MERVRHQILSQGTIVIQTRLLEIQPKDDFVVRIGLEDGVDPLVSHLRESVLEAARPIDEGLCLRAASHGGWTSRRPVKAYWGRCRRAAAPPRIMTVVQYKPFAGDARPTLQKCPQSANSRS